MPDIILLLQSSPTTLIIFVLLIGLMVGSFLNVVIHRLPIMMERGWKQEYQSYFHPEQAEALTPYNLVKPDSECPKCGHKIRAWENIPLLSWLLLGGKCSQCKTPISARYPLVELLTGLLSGWMAWHLGFGWPLLAALFFTWLLVAMTFIDLDKMLLPDQLTLALLWLGLFASTQSLFVSPADAIIGAIAGYLSLWSVYWGFKLLTGKEGMGYGDFKLLAALGAWLGWQYLPMVILASSFVGAIIGLLMLSIQGKDKGQAIPFGPYLAIAGWLTFLYGEPVADYYWHWILS
ncbi:prepilin peptidase [Bowmanella pacifica]|uniref:Prepilin leader peptidase/N-methyltransferase n=1 Tax=Bowmanella pacifica TaxID=502051 RepID=A0A917YY83_9ALTE|nr:A24 family peptidase [Bowmanella pacifica]GGO68813.1 type 4 prepilin-like proteins leader peptide-processing enzyme [Bowmanella pacifica]